VTGIRYSAHCSIGRDGDRVKDCVGEGGVGPDIAEFAKTLDAEIIDLAVFFGNQDHLNYFDVGMPRAAMRACTRLRLSGFWN